MDREPLNGGEWLYGIYIVGRGSTFSNADAGIFPPSAKAKVRTAPANTDGVQVVE
jgi:hypothetical protein